MANTVSWEWESKETNPTTSKGLVRSSPKRCSHPRKFSHHLGTSAPYSPSWEAGHPRGAPGMDLLPILPHVQEELGQTWLCPVIPLSSYPHL